MVKGRRFPTSTGNEVSPVIWESNGTTRNIINIKHISYASELVVLKDRKILMLGHIIAT